MQQLEVKIVKAKQTEPPQWGICTTGYTWKQGGPTSYMIMLEGESRWRRVLLLQFSNAGTLFIKYKKEERLISSNDISAAMLTS